MEKQLIQHKEPLVQIKKMEEIGYGYLKPIVSKKYDHL